jgi:hypothetical protein
LKDGNLIADLGRLALDIGHGVDGGARVVDATAHRIAGVFGLRRAGGRDSGQLGNRGRHLLDGAGNGDGRLGDFAEVVRQPADVDGCFASFLAEVAGQQKLVGVGNFHELNEALKGRAYSAVDGDV